MPRYDRPEESYYLDDEVIGSTLNYHRPTCHIIPQIKRKNYKRLHNWQEAVALGLKPCLLCNPCFFSAELEPEKPKKKIGF